MSIVLHILLALSINLVGGLQGEENELATHTIGRGCCSGPTPPTLEVLVMGSTVDRDRVSLHLGGHRAPCSETGWLLAGLVPGQDHDLGNGGFLHLDPTTMLQLRIVAVDTEGHWACPVDVSAAALTDGFAVQAAFLDPGMSTGWALSDALELRWATP